MNDFLKRTWAEINLDAIKYNFEQVKKRVSPKSLIMCVVKADAYGHGSKYLVREFEELGADWFAVSNIEEAMELRNYGASKPILVLGYTPVCMAGELAEHDISQAVLSGEYAEILLEECRKKGLKVKAHIKIDTGMNRIGFPAKNDDEIKSTVQYIKDLWQQKELIIEGIFTHFSVADDPAEGIEYTRNQFRNFVSVTDALDKKGIKIPLRHCSNSGAIIDYPEMNLDMVRAGVILYGLYPSKDLSGKIDLKPAMQMKTVVSQLKRIPKGSSVSYGRTFVSERETVLATVPVGYADGYSRGFSNCAEMLVCGKRVPVAGRVCMDQLMLDVTSVADNINEGSAVTVFGHDQGNEISADELANLLHTVNYEIVCLVGRRVPRIYFKKGRNIGQLNYMFY